MQTQLSFAERLAVATTALAALHHVDHVLRVDHSGWPFRPEVTPFTYSLLVWRWRRMIESSFCSDYTDATEAGPGKSIT